MFKKYFFLITLFVLIFSLSTGFALPIPDSSTTPSTSNAGRRNLTLMGRIIRLGHEVKWPREELTSSSPSSSSVTREERFSRRLSHRRRAHQPSF